MAKNELYSHGDFTGQDLTSHDVEGFNDTEIVGSCFFQPNSPRSNVFPSGITGVTFVKCNLDNCVIPEGCTLEKSTNLHIKAIDGVDCVVDESEEKLDTLDHYLSVAFWRDV